MRAGKSHVKSQTIGSLSQNLKFYIDPIYQAKIIYNVRSHDGGYNLRVLQEFKRRITIWEGSEGKGMSIIYSVSKYEYCLEIH